MITDQTLQYIVSKLDEQREELEDSLGEGVAKDYPEYQKLCGIIRGLNIAKQVVSDLADRMEKENE